MSEDSLDRDPFEGVAESFLARYRAGERPGIEEYVARYPELADQIRRLLPALVMVEEDLSDDVEPSPPERDAIEGGAIRLGDYRILAEIGRGGMGVVYEAEQLSLGRRVALKVLPHQVARDARALERFRREAKAAARLHHTNIVPVFEVGQDGETAYYTMQFIQGRGLDQIIDELGRLRDRGRPGAIAFAATDAGEPALDRDAGLLLPGRLASDAGPSPSDKRPRSARPAAERSGDGARSGRTLAAPKPDGVASAAEHASMNSAILSGGTEAATTALSGRGRPFFRSVAQIGRQAAQGLAYAHARGVIHRDIKPSNLLLDHTGVVWITDFGLAKGEDEGLTQSGDLLGTIRYMAPERFHGQGDARADVYALGLTLYELLTLRPGFASSDRLRLIERIKNAEPTRPRSIDGRIPRDLETLVLKAIEKDPRARYQTADAMADDLARFLADEPVRARQVGSAERYWRWARRNPAIAALAGAVAALLIAVAIGSMAAAVYFRESARREANLAERELLANRQSQRDREDAIEARQRAIEERDRSRRLSAGLALDKGIALAQEGHADRGLLWMLEALKTAPAESEGFRKAVRWNLGDWLGQVHRTLRIIEIGRPCDSVAFSPDGRSFATGFNAPDHSVAIPIDLWDTASGRKLASLPDAFAPFAFRPDGRVLVAHDDQLRVVAIDLVTRRVLWTSPDLTGNLRNNIAFSPDASTVLMTSVGPPTGQGRLLFQLDAATGRQLGEPFRGMGNIDFSPDGRLFATRRAVDGKALLGIFELASGRQRSSWPESANDLLLSVFSPDARSLFVSERKGGIIKTDSYFGRIWDPVAGKPSSPPMMSTTTAAYTLSADRLVTHTETLWLVRDGRNGQVQGSGLRAGTEAFQVPHPDGRTMMATSDEFVRLWQISPDAEPVPGSATESSTGMIESDAARRARDTTFFRTGLSTDGRIAVASAVDAGGRERICLSEPATGRPLGRPASHYPGWKVRSLAFSADGRYFATGSNPTHLAGEVRIWDAGTGRLRFPPMPHINYVSALAFRPDGKVLASGDFSGQVRVRDTSTGREIRPPLNQGEIVMSLAFSPDGMTLAAGLALDHTGKPGVRLWDMRTGRRIGELLPSSHRVAHMEFRRDGRALLVGTEGNHALQLWDLPGARAIGEPLLDEASGGFRPDGRAFLTVGGDGSVKMRDAATGAILASLLTGPSRAACAAFRGDGGLVAAGFADGSVRFCDPATSQQIGPARFMRRAVHQVTFSADGRAVVAVDDFGESRAWPVPEPLGDLGIDELTLRIEARTGVRMEPGLAISRLRIPAWRDRLEQLRGHDPTAGQPDEDAAWHEPMIREAERNGHAFAALWHLDRLIVARPEDWYLHARRARAWILSDRPDRFERAAADYEHAERLGSRERVLDFQAHCVAECSEAEHWAEALWYLDRLIAASPDDGALREDRAAIYGRLGRSADRQAELARAFELGVDQGLVLPRAEELGRAGRWADAARLLARCGRTGSPSWELTRAWGIAALKAGDRASYREACATLLAGLGPYPPIFPTGVNASSLFAQGADGLDDYREAMRWFEQPRPPSSMPPSLFAHICSNALGGLLLRAGRLDEAIAHLNDGIAAAQEEIPSDWAYLALAHARKGNWAEAHRWLERLRQVTLDPSAGFWDIQEFPLYRGEFESLQFDADFPRNPFQSRGPR